MKEKVQKLKNSFAVFSPYLALLFLIAPCCFISTCASKAAFNCSNVCKFPFGLVHVLDDQVKGSLIRGYTPCTGHTHSLPHRFSIDSNTSVIQMYHQLTNSTMVDCLHVSFACTHYFHASIEHMSQSSVCLSV